MTSPVPGSLTPDDFRRRYEGASQRSLNAPQWRAVAHAGGPLFVMAGPGSGKSEVMVARTLKLVLVDGVDPRSILLTTFTEKAAKNLQERVSDRLMTMGYGASLDDLRVGTLHSLCDRIMREYRYAPYSDTRLLDATEQNFFVYRECAELIDEKKERLSRAFWESFRYLYPSASSEYGPNKWQRAQALVTLFNRAADEDVDLEAMSRAPRRPHLRALAEAIGFYRERLRSRHRTDFANLQCHFADFLASPLGAGFLRGSPGKELPELRHVLIDEYQDTNPLQERIYFLLASGCGGNVTVVGDDDQALYRFRGGTVECLVRFPDKCRMELGLKPDRVQLDVNYRSLPEITQWAEDMLIGHPAMRLAGARAGKKPMTNSRGEVIGHDPVQLIVGQSHADASTQVAFIIREMIRAEMVQDPSQIAVLLKSTRESPRNAGPLAATLRDLAVPVYNPRSKAFLDTEAISAMLGALIEIVDPGARVGATLGGRQLAQKIAEWRDAYLGQARRHKALREYVASVHAEMKTLALGAWLNVTLRDLFYRVLSRVPFATWQDDPAQTHRLGQLSRVLDSFASVEDENSGDTLRMSREDASQISQGWLRSVFYARLIAYLSQAHLDDPEDADHQILPGAVQLMTVHQSKGLEFPVVFVGSLGAAQKETDQTYQLEDLLLPYARNPRAVAGAADRACQDSLRFFYVAYTRAEHGLFLFGAQNELAKADRALGRESRPLKR